MPDESTVTATSSDHKTASAVLIETLEAFGESEPRHVIVLYTNESGELVVNGNVGRAESIGLLSIAKWMLMP